MKLTSYFVQHAPRFSRSQRGSALVVALMMLVVLTVLGITGMNIASTELVMAGGEQDRTRAFNAAEIGVERAIRNLDAVGTAVGATFNTGTVDVEDSPVSAATGDAIDTYETTSAYRGCTDLINEFNGTKFEANHFQIQSQGNSARGARTGMVQGVIKVNTSFGQKTYGGAC
jgi:type IV pilus assembly protein PilX